MDFNEFEYPNKLDKIFDKLDLINIKPIIIGGYVRDKFLQLHSKDIDIELYGIDSLKNLEEILQEFGDVNNVGKSFGVCKLSFEDLEIDFSLPRRDSKVYSGHKGFFVTTDSTLDFPTATSRRDFTINAIGYDVKNKTILDPFNGIKDLQEKTLRAVNLKTFGEDPLRVLRAVQFSSRLNFTLEDKLVSLCQDLVLQGTLKELARERIYDEFIKLLLKSPKPSIGFLVLQNLHIFTYFQELDKLTQKEYIKMIESLDLYEKTDIKKVDIMLMLALICSYLSPDVYISFLNKLTDDKNIIYGVTKYREVLISLKLKKFSNYEVYLLATQVDIELLTHTLKAKFSADVEFIEMLLSHSKKLGVQNKSLKALVGGKDLILLGLKPSKEFSKILTKVYDAQMHQDFFTYNEAIIWLKCHLL